MKPNGNALTLTVCRRENAHFQKPLSNGTPVPKLLNIFRWWFTVPMERWLLLMLQTCPNHWSKSPCELRFPRLLLPESHECFLQGNSSILYHRYRLQHLPVPPGNHEANARIWHGTAGLQPFTLRIRQGTTNSEESEPRCAQRTTNNGQVHEQHHAPFVWPSRSHQNSDNIRWRACVGRCRERCCKMQVLSADMRWSLKS